MKYLIIPIIILLSLSIVFAQTQDQWLTEMKSLYSNYIDSGTFFVIAIVVFFPIIISGLFGMLLGIKGSVSIFLLGIFLGILTFLSYPILIKYLTGMI